MTRLGNKAVIALAVVGLFVGSGIALADSHVEEGDDTVVNYYYDPDADFLFWNVTSLDAQVENWEESYGILRENCLLQGDPYSYIYNGDAITLTPSIDSVECSALIGGFVTGPNGQINKGMVMKLVNSLYEGPRRGCIVSQFAKTNFGKTDMQTASPDFVAPDPQTDPIAAMDFQFTSFEANCIKGKKADADGTHGPPQHVLDKKAEKWGESGKPGKGPKNGD